MAVYKVTFPFSLLHRAIITQCFTAHLFMAFLTSLSERMLSGNIGLCMQTSSRNDAAFTCSSMAMIQALLQPYKNRPWAQTNWILMRLWKVGTTPRHLSLRKMPHNKMCRPSVTVCTLCMLSLRAMSGYRLMYLHNQLSTVAFYT